MTHDPIPWVGLARDAVGFGKSLGAIERFLEDSGRLLYPFTRSRGTTFLGARPRPRSISFRINGLTRQPLDNPAASNYRLEVTNAFDQTTLHRAR